MTGPGQALTPEGLTGNCPDHRRTHTMQTWHVTIKIEATIEVEAESREAAEWKASGDFDPTAYDREIVESWTEAEE